MSEKKLVPRRRFKGFCGDWESKKLKELADFSKGRGYSKNDLHKDGTPIILYGRLYTNYQTIIETVDTYAIEKNQSIISKGNEVIIPASGESSEDISRASVVIKTGVILGGDLNIIDPKDNLESIFLALTISHGEQQKQLSRRAQGKSVVHLHNSDLMEVDLLYPCNKEQTKIGDFFKQLDNLIRLQQKKLDKLKALKQSYLFEMFPSDGESVPKRRFKGFSGDWEEKALGIIFEFKYGLFNNNPSNGGKYPVYGANGVIGEYSCYNAEDSIVIGHMGEYAGSVIWAEGKHFVTYNGIITTPKSLDVNTMFGFFLLYQLNIRKICSGSGQPFLSYDMLQKIYCKFPSIDEQTRIGDFFKQLDNQINRQQRKLEKLQDIKKGYLSEMFV